MSCDHISVESVADDVDSFAVHRRFDRRVGTDSANDDSLSTKEPLSFSLASLGWLLAGLPKLSLSTALKKATTSEVN